MTTATDRLTLLERAHEMTSTFVQRIEAGSATVDALNDLLERRQRVFARLGPSEMSDEHRQVLSQLAQLDERIREWCVNGQQQLRESLGKLRRTSASQSKPTSGPAKLVSESA